MLSKALENNLGFISECLADTGIDANKNNLIYTQAGCVLIAAPEEKMADYKHIRKLLCLQDKAVMERGLAIVNNALSMKNK